MVARAQGVGRRRHRLEAGEGAAGRDPHLTEREAGVELDVDVHAPAGDREAPVGSQGVPVVEGAVADRLVLGPLELLDAGRDHPPVDGQVSPTPRPWSASQEGIFAKDLAPDKLDASKTFNAGPAENRGAAVGAIDVAFIGPSPSINAFTKSNGAVQIIAGATSGGAGLVTKPSITSVDELKGKTIATPQLANTQDVALRAFLKTKGFKTDTEGGGDVHVKPQDNSQTIVTVQAGPDRRAPGCPSPTRAQMVAAGGHVLVDESSLWPDGQWVTTNVLVRTAFLKAHPATVTRFLTGCSTRSPS